MKQKILELLKEQEDYLSGQMISEKLHVSRTAVWKAIKQLKEEGYVIDSVNNRGYRLVEAADVMNEAEVVSQLATNWLGRPLRYFDEIDSTNEYLKREAAGGLIHGTVALANEQTAGKGRLGRSWSSPTGSSIYISYLLRPDIAPIHASMLTIVAALATARAIEDTTGLNAGIKWPNDIVVNKHKVCGILTEMSSDMDRIQYVIVGIGVNVNMTEFPEEIKETATSLRLETGEVVRRAPLVAKMLFFFEHYYELFLKTEDLSGLLADYNAHLVNKGKQVRIVERTGEWTAIAEEMDEKGELVVTLPDGTKKNIISGEVSVRGLYGYV